MSDESFVAPGFLEQERPTRDAPTSKEPPGLTSGTALSVLWWIAEDDADDAANDSASDPVG